MDGWMDERMDELMDEKCPWIGKFVTLLAKDNMFLQFPAASTPLFNS
jgi:hypothetical protein